MRARRAGDKSEDPRRIKCFGCGEAVRDAVDEQLLRTPGGTARRPELELPTARCEVIQGMLTGYPLRVCSSTWKSRLRSVSLERSAVIVRHACSTVVWSRLPNASPISGRLISVSSLASAIAIWRGRATLRLRFFACRSATLIL